MLRRLYFDSLTHDRGVLADLVGFAGATGSCSAPTGRSTWGDDRSRIRALRLADDRGLILSANAAGCWGSAAEYSAATRGRLMRIPNERVR